MPVIEPSREVMMKALLLHRDIPYHGGVAQSFLNLVRFRDRRRLGLCVATFRLPSEEMRTKFTRFKAAVYTIGDQGYWRPAWRLRQIITTNTFEIIICGSFKSYLIAKTASVGLTVRVLFWIPGIDLVISGWLRWLIFRMLARKDTLIFVSEAVRRAYTYAEHHGKQAVIYHGVEDPFSQSSHTPYSRKQRHARIRISGDCILFGYVAEFIGWKDHRTLLNAFNKVADALPNAELVLIGMGKEMATIKDMAKLLPCHNRIVFLGARTDARRLLGLIDIYVHPSRGEGFGLAVVEAMLASVPVIVSDEGAFPEYIADGVTGLTFPAGDAVALAKRMLELANNQALATQIGAAGRAHSLIAFDPHRFADEMTDILVR